MKTKYIVTLVIETDRNIATKYVREHMNKHCNKVSVIFADMGSAATITKARVRSVDLD